MTTDTTSVHPNARLARRAWNALLRGDDAAISRSFTEDVVWHLAGTSGIANDYVGRDELKRLFRVLAAATSGTFTGDIDAVIADEDLAVVILHVVARRNGSRLDTSDAIVFQATGGKITEAWVYEGDPREDAFWRAMFGPARPTTEPLLRPTPVVPPREPRTSQLPPRATTTRATPSEVRPAGPAPVVRPPREPIGPKIRHAASVFASEFGLHALAYLGVLLMFAGTFGLVFFAFGEVRVSLRPAAEVAIPLSFFAGAAILRGKGAPFVSRGLELVGGALLPVVVYAAFVDSATVPPDVHGLPLVVTLTATSVVLACAYAAWTRAHEGSMLRYLIAPVVWLAAGTAAIGARTVDFEIRTIDALQGAVVLATVAGSLAVARFAKPFARDIQVAALPGAVVAYALAILAAGRDGWPAGPMIATAVAAVVAIGLLEARFGGGIAPALLQFAVIAGGAAAIGVHHGRGWAGAAAVLTLASLVEWRGRVGIDRQLALAACAAVGVAALASTDGRVAPLVAFTALAAWTHARRIRPPAWAPTVVWTAGAIAAPVGVLLALGNRIVDEGPLLVATAALLFTASVAVTRTKVAERFWLRSLAVWSGAVALLSLGTEPRTPSWQIAVAAAFAGSALAVVRLPAAARVWPSAASLTIAVAFGFDAVGAGGSGRLLIWSALAVALVAAGTQLRSALSPHLIAVGHLAAIGTALVADVPTSVHIAVMAAFVAGFGATVFMHETGGSPLIDAIGRVRPWLAAPAAAAGVLATLAGLQVLVGDVVRQFDGGPRWTTIALAASAIAYVASTRAIATRTPLAPILAHGAIVLTLVAMATSVDDTPTFVLATAVGALTAPVMHARVRRLWLVWFSWAVSAPFVVRTAEWAGVSAETSDIGFALLGWAVVCTVGALVLDDVLAGRREIGQAVRTPWLVPPVVLGSLGLVAGMLTVTDQPETVWTWTALALAAVFGALAYELRTGILSLGSYVFATVGVALLVPWTPLDHPWTLAIWTAVLVAAWWAARIFSASRSILFGWRLPPLALAHGVAILALAATGSAGSVTATWTSIGALALVVTYLTTNPVWAVAGVGLMLVGAADAGSGWLALGLAGTSCVATALSARSRGSARRALQSAAVLSAAAAWVAVIAWLEWASPTWVPLTAVAGGSTLLALAGAVRARLVALDHVAWWGSLGGAALIIASAMSGNAIANDFGAWTSSGRTSEIVVKLWIALGWMLASGALTLAAKPVGLDVLRDGAVASKLAAWGFILWAVDPSIEHLTWFVTGGGALFVATALVIWMRDQRSAWLRPVTLGGAAVVVMSLATALRAWPRRDLAVAALVTAGLEAIVASLVLRRPAIAVPAPVVFGAAWLLFASETLTGDAQWFTVPSAIAMLAVVDIARADRSARGVPRAATGLLAMEAMGIALFIVPSLVQTVTADIVYGAVGIGLSVVLAAWAALTRVKRRLVAASAGILVSVFLLIGVPLTGFVRDLRGAGIWLAISVFGLVLLAAAATLERTRSAMRSTYTRASSLLDDWE